jgi:hypothetical protein
MHDQTTKPTPSAETACYAYEFPWKKNQAGWIISADGRVVCTMSGCGIGPDDNGRIVEAAGDMLELVKRVAKGGMSYPAYDRKMAEAILAKVFQHNVD